MFGFVLMSAAWAAYWEAYHRSALDIAQRSEDRMYAANCGAQRAAIEAIQDLERVCREHATLTEGKR